MDFWIHSHPYDYGGSLTEAFTGLLQRYPMKITGIKDCRIFLIPVMGGLQSYDPAWKPDVRGSVNASIAT